MASELVEFLVAIRGAREASTQIRGVAESTAAVSEAQAAVGRSALEADAKSSRFVSALQRVGRAATETRLKLLAVSEASAGIHASVVAGGAVREPSPGSSGHRSGASSVAAGAAGGRGVGGMGLLGAGAAVVGAGALVGLANSQGVRSSIDSVSALSRETQLLTSMTGMDAQTAADWVAVADSRGISVQKLNLGFKTLATQTTAGIAGTKSSMQMFNALGITHAQLTANSHNLSGMLGLVADKLNAMPGGAEKTAIAAKLLGRGFASLNPLMIEGSKGMSDLRKLAQAYGVTMGGDTAKNLVKLRTAQENMNLAMTGLKVTFVRDVAPALMWVTTKLIAFIVTLKDGLKPAIAAVILAVKTVIGWFNGLPKPVQTIIKAVGMFVGIAATVSTAWFGVSKIFGGVKLAMAAIGMGSPVMLAIAGIATVAVLIVTHWKEVKRWIDHNKVAVIALAGVITPLAGIVAGAFVTAKISAFEGFITKTVVPALIGLAAKFGLVGTAAATAGTAEAAAGAATATAGIAFAGILGPLGAAAAAYLLLHKNIDFAAGSTAAMVTAGLQARGVGFASSDIVKQLTAKGAFGNVPGVTNPAAMAGPPIITQHARGGIFRRPTLGVIGEAGPEAVVPLSKMSSAPFSQMGGGSGWSHGDIVVKVDRWELARVLRSTMQEAQARGA